MIRFDLQNCKYDFASDSINIFVLVYDESGSMNGDVTSMRRANKAFFNDFSNFEEKGSIAIAKAIFSNEVWMSCFEPVENFSTNYDTGGGTELYYAIDVTASNAIEYYKELVKRLNVRVRITYIVFSDGGDTSGNYNLRCRAQEAIKELNSLDATTVFVAFREAISSGVPEDLGFTCTRNINTVKELISCMGGELSKSCKEQSRSAYSLKSEFFSKADKNSDEDKVEAQPLVDDDFFNII